MSRRNIILVGNPNSGKTTVFNGLTRSRQRVGNWPGVTVEKIQGTMLVNAPSLEMVTGRHESDTQSVGVAVTPAGTVQDDHGPDEPERVGGSPRVQAVAELHDLLSREGGNDKGAVSPGGHDGTPRTDSRSERGGSLEHLVVDLPGIYSLHASSEDEIVARDVITDGDYDLIVNIVDAANLERNLYLTLQLIEMERPVIVVLNMIDRATTSGVTVDAEHLAHHLGCPVIPATATTREGIEAIRQGIEAALLQPERPNTRVSYPDPVETVLSSWSSTIASVAEEANLPPRYIALRILENDRHIRTLVERDGSLGREQITEVAEDLTRKLPDDIDIVLADGRYGFIHGVARDVVTRAPSRETITEKIDNVVMHRWFGIPVFLGAMYLVFWATLAVGGAFIDFFDILFGTFFVDGVGALLRAVSAPEWLVTIVADGIGAGIQTVGTFVPIIFMMFFMLSLLESSGYMARAAFVMDRVMRYVGLPGKSFVPMLVGFGCTVPAITGTRTLESKKDRFMTIFMAPFMSCGARLPVYALFAAAFFPGRSGLVVFSLYFAGIILAILTGVLLKHTLFGSEYSHFVMELPTYHIPRLGATLRSAWQRLRIFIVRAGVTIVAVVTILGVLNSLGTDGSFGRQDTEDSVLSAVGKTITPVFTPMGIEEGNWPATVGLFTGLFAKEAVVGTLSSLYSQSAATSDGDDAAAAGPESEESSEAGAEDVGFDAAAGVIEAFRTIPANLAGVFGALLDPLGLGLISDDEATVASELEVENTLFGRMRGQFSPQGAYAYLLFVLIYFPCVAALGAAVKEMGRGYAWLLAGYLTVLAWAVATLVYQITTGPQLVPVLGAVGVLVGIVALFAALGSRSRQAVA
ncbi:MAG: ferrous iron transport protein B [Alkalispirochaeta sp.]